MTFSEAIRSGCSNYAKFAGRSSRSAFWWWQLFIVIGGMVTLLIDGLLFPRMDIGLVNGLFALATFLPGLALTVRRLHDIDRSGWWILIIIIPLIGICVLLYWWVQPSQPGENRFGLTDGAAGAQGAGDSSFPA